MAGTSLRKHNENARRHYLTVLSFSRRKLNEFYLQRAQALQFVQKVSEPEDPVPCSQHSVANRHCRHHGKAESSLERNTSIAESERPVNGKREVKLIDTTGFLVLKHGPNTMLNITA